MLNGPRPKSTLCRPMFWSHPTAMMAEPLPLTENGRRGATCSQRLPHSLRFTSSPAAPCSSSSPTRPSRLRGFTLRESSRAGATRSRRSLLRLPDGLRRISLPCAAASGMPPPPLPSTACASGGPRRSKAASPRARVPILALPGGGGRRALRRPLRPRGPKPRDFRVSTARHTKTSHKPADRSNFKPSSSLCLVSDGAARWRGRRRTSS
jgi:hypothetical protein